METWTQRERAREGNLEGVGEGGNMDPKRKRERGISKVWVRVETWTQRERGYS